ncbi:MAG TPA: glycosyltransferase family 2 protein [Pyrinomonadaceae bacterium]
MLTLLSHFYNEELLMPYWLKHHYPLFDHGVLIDYASTDRSVEIARELAPGWEIIASRNEDFAAVACDAEVMEIERRFSGWKICLNTTEFLVYPGLREFLASFERENPEIPAAALTGYIVLADPPRGRWNPLNPELPLLQQCHYGVHDLAGSLRRWRYVHRAPDGAYAVGRHDTAHAWRSAPDGGIAHFLYAPWPEARARKLQIQRRMTESDRQLGLGFHHFVTPQELDSRCQEFWWHQPIRDLRELPSYWRVVEELS